MKQIFSILSAATLLLSCGPAAASERPLIFPTPRELTTRAESFTIDGQSSILLPVNASKNDLLLARSLAIELSDRYGFEIRTRRAGTLPRGGKFILMGSIANPLVKAWCARNRVTVTPQAPGTDGYVLRASNDVVLVAGSDDRGAFYGMQSVRQLIQKTAAGGLTVPGVDVRDWPDKPFRGIKVYLPGRMNIPYFKRFLRDFMALYKFNKVIIEMNACMRLDRHPELNAGWVEFARDTNYSRRNYPPGPPHQLRQNSSHQDTADGGFIEKEDVADIVRWAQANYIEVIPEIPSFTHSYYLLTRHKDLSDLAGEKWSDTFCPSNPKSYQLLFDVFDEYIDVMKPKMVHIGHDEWFAPIGQCPLCRGKDPGDLYAQDLVKTHDYLAKKGIRMAIWGDVLLEGVRGKGPRQRRTRDGWTYMAPGALTPEQVARVPKDILIFNWFWSGRQPERAKANEAQLDKFGFSQIYGNFEPRIIDYESRSKRKTILGGAPSSWAATTEFNLGKDLMYDFLGCENLLWSRRATDPQELARTVQAMLPDVRERLHGDAEPSAYGDSVEPVDISPAFNMPAHEPLFDVDLSAMKSGRVTLGSKVFELATRSGDAAVAVGAEGAQPNPLPREATVKVDQDATSLIFLHACAKPATNKKAYRLLWDQEDSADMLGFYEVVYEDGFIETIPIRYGVNILEWNWGKAPREVCYGADVLEAGNGSPVTFFAYEWPNPRLGKVITEVRLVGTTKFRGAVPGFEDFFGPVIPNNAVILKALSYVKKR